MCPDAAVSAVDKASVKKRFCPPLVWDAEVQSYLEEALGVAVFERLSAAICTPPLTTCVRVNTLRTTREEVARQLRQELQSRPSYQNLSVSLHQAITDAVLLHGHGPNTVDYTAKAGKEVILNRKAGEAVLRGAHAFVPGVIASSAGIEKGDLVAVCLVPDSADGKQPIPRGTVIEAAPFLPARENFYLGVGRVQMSRKEMFKAQSGLAVVMEQPAFQTLPINGLLTGRIIAQNLPSLVAAHVLAPKPGSRVCDLCAAPGGKSTALAQIMENEGTIYALDRSHNKIQDILSLADELGITCIRAHKMDATQACRQCSREPINPVEPTNKKNYATGLAQEEDISLRVSQGNAKNEARRQRKAAAATLRGQTAVERTMELPAAIQAFEPESFDYVLLDAPCTALGLRPRVQQTATMVQLQMAAVYQRKMMCNAVALLKPGGFWVYSTCTLNPGENEANVRFVLDSFPEMILVPQTPRLGGPGLIGGSKNGERWLSAEESSLVQRFDPSASADTIGFFIAKFQKVSGTARALEASEHSKNGTQPDVKENR